MSLDFPGQLGDVVLWFEGGEGASAPAPGIISATGMGTAVTINVVTSNLHNFRIVDGCRHADDHKATAEERESAGAWRHTPQALQALVLAEQLGNTGEYTEVVATA